MTPAVQTRERLVRAAQEELIQSHGLWRCRRSRSGRKVSVGLAYHHFGSKAGLIAAVVEGVLQPPGRGGLQPLEAGLAGLGGPREGADRRLYRLPLRPSVRASRRRRLEPRRRGARRRAGLHQAAARRRRAQCCGRPARRRHSRRPRSASHHRPDDRRHPPGADRRPDERAAARPAKLTEKIWVFIAGALRLTAVRHRKNRRDKVA